jgi:hypothetical protein
MLAKPVAPVHRAAARCVVTCLMMVLGFGLSIPLGVAAAALLVTIGVPNEPGAAAVFCSAMVAAVAAVAAELKRARRGLRRGSRRVPQGEIFPSAPRFPTAP